MRTPSTTLESVAAPVEPQNERSANATALLDAPTVDAEAPLDLIAEAFDEAITAEIQKISGSSCCGSCGGNCSNCGSCMC